jgi:hypothetical protein
MFGSWYDFKVGMVRMFTKSEYSHVGIAWTIGGRLFVLEAVVPYVRIYPLSKSGDFYWLSLATKWEPLVEEVALSKIGYPYSQINAMQAFFKDLGDEDVSECAAYAIYVSRVAGVELGHRATPDSVVLMAQRIPGVETVYVVNKEKES